MGTIQQKHRLQLPIVVYCPSVEEHDRTFTYLLTYLLTHLLPLQFLRELIQHFFDLEIAIKNHLSVKAGTNAAKQLFSVSHAFVVW